jgi:hypothetical protein
MMRMHPPRVNFLQASNAPLPRSADLCEKSDILDMEVIEHPQADIDLLDWEAESMATMQLKVWPRASAREQPPATSHDEGRCDSHSGDELNYTESDENNGKSRPMKRKRPSSSHGPMHKKPKHRLQQRSTGQH